MKNQSKNFSLACAALALMVAAAPAEAKLKIFDVFKKGDSKEKVEVAEPATPEPQVDLDELNFTEMVNSVPLDAKSADLIRKFQDKEGRNRLLTHFKNLKDINGKEDCTVETFRNKEVLLVTIPASRLFGPNSTELLEGAGPILAPFKRYLKDPDMYRVLMVMHTDNTGSEVYRDYLTEERSKAVADWFEDQGSDVEYLFPFAFGDDMPLVENNSMTNREKNRRLEIYLVPGKKMLAQAKKGRIVF